ncbi:3-ketoacyl-ACP reductase [Neisseria elongata]|uniref:3-oxoacyl-[acyl-carrier-protein] reductase n=1 Tax=Neisseria elongata TaxID=495 RepID=A0A378TWX0_NEIEL|nr:3-oxoacyl-ACP reductase FabG [Neisseria elongata]SFH12759.1 3-oxoacyl-[acyl-carrier-protein] reductase [Neisseria elongata subsp. elongata]STZ67499.1 3-ketoacyl-ACP reductase [Neisseria elongata]
MSSQDLSGKIALVTGASRGIGAAIADTLAQAGATVVGTATSDSGAAAIGERLAQWNGQGKALNAAEADGIENLIADIEKEFGKLDILVNNAGITRDNLLMRMKEEEWDEIMQVNLKSVFRASKAVLRGMMKQRSGRIINITSVVGAMGNAGQANYAAAKAGLMGFAKSMAREVGSRGITVNCVAPGFIDTDMTRALPEEVRKTFEAQTALGRFGDAQDIADAVLFLASDQAKYITGQTLHVNGGMLMP